MPLPAARRAACTAPAVPTTPMPSTTAHGLPVRPSAPPPRPRPGGPAHADAVDPRPRLARTPERPSGGVLVLCCPDDRPLELRPDPGHEHAEPRPDPRGDVAVVAQPDPAEDAVGQA